MKLEKLEALPASTAQQAIMTSLPRSWPAPPQEAGSGLQPSLVLPLLSSRKKAKGRGPPSSIASMPTLNWWDVQAPRGLYGSPFSGPKFFSSSEPPEHFGVLASVLRPPLHDRPAGRTDRLGIPARPPKAPSRDMGEHPCLPLDTLPPLPGLHRGPGNPLVPAGDSLTQENPALSWLQIQPSRPSRVTRPSKCSSPPLSSPTTRLQISTSGSTSQALPSLHGNQPKTFPGELPLSSPVSRQWNYLSDNVCGHWGAGHWPTKMQTRHEEMILPPSSNSFLEISCPSRSLLRSPVLDDPEDILKGMFWNEKEPFRESLPFQWEPEGSIICTNDLNVTKIDIQASPGPKKGSKSLSKSGRLRLGKARPSGSGGGNGSHPAKSPPSEVQGTSIRTKSISKVGPATIKRSRSSKVTSRGRSKRRGIRVGLNSQETGAPAHPETRAVTKTEASGIQTHHTHPTEEPTLGEKKLLPPSQGPFFYIGGTNGAVLISSYCRSKGWQRIHDNRREDYKLKWCETKCRDTYYSFREGEQLLYQIPNNKLLTTKIGLLNALREYARVMSKISRSPTAAHIKVLKMEDFFPETYRLDVKDERENFITVFHDEEIWICKPTASNQGKGIFLIRTQEEAISLQAKMQSIEDDPTYKKMPFKAPQARVIQRYIHNPLLLDGKKFDVRSYLLIACAMPYMVFFSHGYARLTLSLYDPKAKDLAGHLTNQFMQKKSPLYVLLKEETVWSMERLNKHINEKFRRAKGLPRDWVLTTFTKRMQQIMLQCFLAVKSKLECKLGYFDLIGCDFLIDENFKVWLLEMNSNPALHTNCEVLKEVVPRVVHETLDLALETFHKSLRTERMFPLLSQRNFVLLHSGSSPAKAADRSLKKPDSAKPSLKRTGLSAPPVPVHPKSALHQPSPHSVVKGQPQALPQEPVQPQPPHITLPEEPEAIADPPNHMFTLLRPLASNSSDFWFQGALDLEPPLMASNDLFLPLYPSRMLSLSFPSAEPIPSFDTPSLSEVQDSTLDSFLGLPEYERKDLGYRGS
uniref:Tubulin tyrosine ligase like 10 n=1 Tax=Sarcophilus harrisii TaxID=9305 RepID=A0A7N4P780_SARHA